MYIRHGRGRKKTGSHVTADDKTEYESTMTRSSRVILFGYADRKVQALPTRPTRFRCAETAKRQIAAFFS